MTTVPETTQARAVPQPGTTYNSARPLQVVEVEPTQMRRPWRSTARTVFQAFVMLCAIAPAIYSAAAEQSPELATGYAAVGLAIAGAVTRIMAVPKVERFLRRFLPLLAAAPKPEPVAKRRDTYLNRAGRAYYVDDHTPVD